MIKQCIICKKEFDTLKQTKEICSSNCKRTDLESKCKRIIEIMRLKSKSPLDFVSYVNELLNKLDK
jgi:hypothetical protein